MVVKYIRYELDEMVYLISPLQAQAIERMEPEFRDEVIKKKAVKTFKVGEEDDGDPAPPKLASVFQGPITSEELGEKPQEAEEKEN